MEVQSDDVYGAGFPVLDRLRLLAEFAPLFAQLQLIASAETPHDRAVAVVRTLQWAAGKSVNEIDDEALRHIESILGTDEGKAAFAWVYGLIAGGDK